MWGPSDEEIRLFKWTIFFVIVLIIAISCGTGYIMA